MDHALFNERVNKYCAQRDVKGQVSRSRDDRDMWRRLILDILITIAEAASKTSWEAQIIAPKDAIEITYDLSDDELSELRDLVRRGLESGDWMKLVMHRVCLLVSNELASLTALQGGLETQNRTRR